MLRLRRLRAGNQTRLHSSVSDWQREKIPLSLKPQIEKQQRLPDTSKECINDSAFYSGQPISLTSSPLWRRHLGLPVTWTLPACCVTLRLRRPSSSYLSSSVCWARSCCAAARAARPCTKLFWVASEPEPPEGAVGWAWAGAWGSAEATP